MPVLTKYNESLGVVEATWTGIITKQELADATEEHLRFHINNGVLKFLNDFSTVERLSLSMLDLFELPDNKVRRIERKSYGANRANQTTKI